ncbi:MAG: lysophospholipid acyltransferase family protein [Muribaculaceae bacterium]|nr:lysophospholipid acyltransferase family protein [Muribaculaceae bacterium]
MKKIDNFKYNLVYWPLKIFSKLPLKMLYPLSSFGAWMMRDVVKYRRNIVENNLKKAFPNADKKQIDLWSKQFYRYLCDTFLEAGKLLGISDKEVDKRIKVYNAEIVDKAVEEGHSVVLFLGHYGNWEWVPAIVRHFKNNAEMVQIYHPLSDKVFDRLMLKIRSRFGSESIPMANTYRRLVEIERSGNKFVGGFISDQRPRGHHADNWTDFLGIETDYFTGGEIIGNRLNCRFIYLDVEPTKRGHYNLTFKEIKPIEDGKEFPYTRSYLRLLEETIRRNPPFWLWSHKRFSHKPKD